MSPDADLKNGVPEPDNDGFILDQGRVQALVDTYEIVFRDEVDSRLPTIINNEEYAARCAALMIALNRQLARVAAACGETQGIDDQVMGAIVVGQFAKNHAGCVEALRLKREVEGRLN